METGNLKCPHCGENDKVQKVSAIVAGQTYDIHGTSIESQVYTDKEGKTHYQSSSVPYSGTQISVLAQRLSPPRKPSAGSDTLVFLLVFGLWIFAALCGLMSLYVAAVMLFGHSTPYISSTSERIREAVMWGGMFMVFAIPAGIIGTVIYKVSSAARKKKLVQVQADMPRWENAVERWNRLYYCFRDDNVFIPSENRGVPISQMMEYIYEKP